MQRMQGATPPPPVAVRAEHPPASRSPAPPPSSPPATVKLPSDLAALFEGSEEPPRAGRKHLPDVPTMEALDEEEEQVCGSGEGEGEQAGGAEEGRKGVFMKG